MQNRTDGKTNHVVVWSIDNFSCWNNEIHEKVIISPESLTSPTYNVKLYPRGLSGNEEHLVVILTSKVPWTFRGELSFIGPNESLLCTQQVDSKERKSVLELPPGPKFEKVVDQIRQNEVLHGDRLILRFRIEQTQSGLDRIEHMHTAIDALEVSLKIYPEIFKIIESTHDTNTILRFPHYETELEPIELGISKDRNDYSKILLNLITLLNVSIRTRMTVLNNEDVVRTEENEHILRSCISWDFCNSLTFEEVETMGFSLILYFKIIPSAGGYKHSFGFYQFCPFKMDIMPTNSISRPLDAGISEKHVSKSLSNVTSQKSDSSIIELTKELMCLFQDQDFSDFQLKCENVSFPVHRAILSARSPVFKTMLSTDMTEASSGCMDIEDMNASTLCQFLAFLYTGTVEQMQGESALNLYYAADKYQVPSLKRECVSVLCSGVSISNVCDILSLANRHQDDQLIKVANDFFLHNYSEVLASEGWKTFMRREPLLAVETVTDFGEKKCVGKIGSA